MKIIKKSYEICQEELNDLKIKYLKNLKESNNSKKKIKNLKEELGDLKEELNKRKKKSIFDDIKFSKPNII